MSHLLYVEDDDTEISEWIQGQLKDTERRLAEGRAVLIYLQNQLVNLACDDPGAAIGAQVALPFLQVGCAWYHAQCCGRPLSALPFGIDGLVRCPKYLWLSASQGSRIASLKHLRRCGVQHS